LHKTGDNILYEQFALDIWRFSYYTGGIDFSTCANLLQENVFEAKEGDWQLKYLRVKTQKWNQVPLTQVPLAIIEKYRKPNNDYIFPILDSNVHKTAKQQKNRIHDVNSKVNDHLKKIGEELGLPIKLTTYVSRHSSASKLNYEGEPTGVIKRAMGHSSEQMTQKYIDDSFGSKKLRSGFEKL
jgi:integrase